MHKCWWDSEDSESHRSVMSAVRSLREELFEQRELDRHHLRMYSNRLALKLFGESFFTRDLSGRLKVNLIRAVINTGAAMIATNKTRAMFLTQKGNREERERGKLLGRFCVSARNHLRQHRVNLQVFKDAGRYGDGFNFIYPDFGRKRICSERVLPFNLAWDEMEAAETGELRTLYYFREVDPEAIIADLEAYAKSTGEKVKIEEARAAIRDSESIQDSYAPIMDYGNKTVTKVHAWRLPDSPDKPGRHVVCVGDYTLLDEEWPWDFFPISKFSMDEAHGWRSVGWAEELSSIQVEINDLMRKQQEGLRMQARKIWIEKGSIPNRSMDNRRDGINEYIGKPPTLLDMGGMDPAIRQQVFDLWQRGFEQVGINAMMATGAKPGGIDSGVAIRNYRDTTSRRHLHVQQMWEDYQVHDVDRRLVWAARRLHKAFGQFPVTVKERRGLEMLDFGEVDLDESRYLMQVHPVNLLPDEPAGLMQTLKEFSEVDPAIRDQLLSHAQYPDLEDAVSKANIQRRMVEHLIEQMLDTKMDPEESYRPPDPFIDPDVALPMVKAAALEAEIEGVPDEYVQNLRDFAADTVALWEQQQPPSAPGPAGPPGAPPQLGPGAPPAGPALPPGQPLPPQ